MFGLQSSNFAHKKSKLLNEPFASPIVIIEHNRISPQIKWEQILFWAKWFSPQNIVSVYSSGSRCSLELLGLSGWQGPVIRLKSKNKLFLKWTDFEIRWFYRGQDHNRTDTIGRSPGRENVSLSVELSHTGKFAGLMCTYRIQSNTSRDTFRPHLWIPRIRTEDNHSNQLFTSPAMSSTARNFEASSLQTGCLKL